MAKHSIHYFIKNALIKEGWAVTDDPLTIDLSEDDTYFDIDLAAEKGHFIQEGKGLLPLKSNHFKAAQ